MFKKILVANRGEIAVRVIRGCREMGIQTVAVYSESDRRSLHVQVADEAVCIGPPPAADSYLDMARVIDAARSTGAEAIHPGYGFLAENAEFARMCEKSGLVFIGPKSESMELVGDKVRARTTMEKAGIPIIPGMKGTLGSLDDYAREATAIAYPVMIKASAGGGGKGMRIARDEESLRAGVESGRREAKGAFGDDSVYLEKYIEDPRHVEVQILADNYGHTIHLFERECSIQRRHQKIIEESPSPALDPELRQRMGETAIEVVKAAGYNNAGTVEFLLDRDRNYYFLEVNARLQVEHPVTELVTGVDLVHQQIRMAAGEKLSLRQENLRQQGHAIECRIYAEDPRKHFLPSPGTILFLKEPSGPGIRHDSGIYGGWEVPIHYDPILAKLIVWAENRETACRRMISALNDYVILGVETSIGFLTDVFSHPAFLEGRTTTGFIGEHFDEWQGPEKTEEGKRLAALAAAHFSMGRGGTMRRGPRTADRPPSPWETLGLWRMGGGN
ncbi:MAG: acetyl-CoA carboxylase biotin carboxylase subunit [Candidatus Aminicenantes bacterium]|nr:acetyl-CoA carboxylase biotin carboxylase subunit [Candidatus Aminicenantes bacterium]